MYYLTINIIGTAFEMMVYLSFLVCVIAGGDCHTVVPIEEPFVGLSACQMQGMLLTPQWQEQHPGLSVRRIRCSIGGRPPYYI